MWRNVGHVNQYHIREVSMTGFGGGKVAVKWTP